MIFAILTITFVTALISIEESFHENERNGFEHEMFDRVIAGLVVVLLLACIVGALVEAL